MAWVTALCFLGSQICLVLGQGFIPQVPREVPSRAGVINDSPTAGPWVIFELRLFFDVECQKESQLTPFFTEVYDTGTHRETELFTNGQYVFDGAEYTNWTADCRVSLGGCPARTVSVGADITGLAGYTAAVARKDALWNITGPLFDAITIKCFRIWQSSDPRHKCNDIGIVRGYPNGNDYLYDVVEVFHAVSGGDWAQRPALFDTLWRVQNLEVTYGQWSLSELHFFEDVLCTFPLQGQAFAIGSDNALVDGDVNAFDHNVTSVWTALCPAVPNSRAHEIWGDGFKFHGCEPEQAFIGQEYQVASTVRCLRFFQKTPRDISDCEQRISWSAGIALQRWSGEDWFTTERFWDSAAAYDPVLAPTMVTPLVGGAPGTWEDLRPPSRSAWRLSNDVYTRGQWVVHELEFHTATHCLGDKLKGEPLAMQGPQNLEIRYAFDGDTRQDVGWTSSCSSRTEGITCVPAEAWLGIYVRGQQPVVKCFRILQSKYLEEQSAFVSLGVYIDGNWQFDSFHREIGGGTWNRRPALPWTIWRLRNNEALEAQWRVAELKAYRDPLCLVLHVSLEQALFGFSISWRHLGEETVTIVKDRLERPDEVLRLKGKGLVQSGNKRGDLYVRLAVDLPEVAGQKELSLSAKNVEALQAEAKLEMEDEVRIEEGTAWRDWKERSSAITYKVSKGKTEL